MIGPSLSVHLGPLPAWQEHAACALMPRFCAQSENDQRAVCRRCPVMHECFAWAMEEELLSPDPPVDMYGGVSASARGTLRRKLRRQRGVLTTDGHLVRAKSTQAHR